MTVAPPPPPPPYGNCARFAAHKNGTIDCHHPGGVGWGHELSICGKCQELQGPELDFSWGSNLQKSSRKRPLEPRVSCHGVRDFTRLCYFKDILWDLEDEKWVVFGRYSSVLEALAMDAKAGVPWIRLDRCATHLGACMYCQICANNFNGHEKQKMH